MSILTVLVFALLVGGVVTTVVPKAPGGVNLSMAGVLLYWWSTDFSEPSTALLVVLTLVGVLVHLSGLLTPVIVGKIGGTPVITTTIGGLVGAVLFFVGGLTGLVVGTAATVFVLEYLRRGDVVESLTAAVVVILASFAGRAARTLATVFILVVMVAVVFL